MLFIIGLQGSITDYCFYIAKLVPVVEKIQINPKASVIERVINILVRKDDHT